MLTSNSLLKPMFECFSNLWIALQRSMIIIGFVLFSEELCWRLSCLNCLLLYKDVPSILFNSSYSFASSKNIVKRNNHELTMNFQYMVTIYAWEILSFYWNCGTVVEYKPNAIACIPVLFDWIIIYEKKYIYLNLIFIDNSYGYTLKTKPLAFWNKELPK